MRAWKLFRRDESGSTLIIVAFAAVAMVGAVGVAVDVGRSQMVKSKLQSAVDAAGLAAGSTLNTNDLTTVAKKYVNLNFNQGTLGATLDSVTATLSADKKIITVTAAATLPTAIASVLGQSSVALGASTEITRANKGLELAMVLDTTGSMAGTKLAALKTAAHNLTDILFGTGATPDNLWVGVVPFSMTVNVGGSHTDWLDPTYNATLKWTPATWAGCMEARYTTGRDITDDPPYDLALPNANPPAIPYERMKPYYSPLSTWVPNGQTGSVTLCNNSSSCTCTNYGPCLTSETLDSGNSSYKIACSGSGNNKICKKNIIYYKSGPTAGPNTNCPSALTPLTNDKTVIGAGIDALVANGNTHVNDGAVWGWRLISPRWRGYWGGGMNTNNLPLNYNSPLMSKAVIIMTDGANTSGSYSAYPASTPTSDFDTKLTQVCNAMRAKNVIVYTVLFQENNNNIKTLLKNCATTPDYFFDSPTEDALKSAFQTIGDSLANLRISK